MRFRLFVYAFVAMPILALIGFVLFKKLPSKELKYLWPVQAFALTDQQGQQVSNLDLQHKVWVANFLFTRCSEQCPLLVSQLKKLQNKFSNKQNFRIVSFTVDPLHDSSAVLKEYATKLEAKPSQWLFLTGTRSEMEKVFFSSFKVSGTTMDKEFQGGMSHSTHFVLVDGQGTVRGYYDSMDQKALEMLIRDASQLLKEIF